MKKKIMATVLAVAVVAAATPAISADAATVKSSYVVGVNKTKTIKVPAKVKKVTVKNKAIVKATKSGKKVTMKQKLPGSQKSADFPYQALKCFLNLTDSLCGNYRSFPAKCF